MSEEEALRILGLAETATPQEIRRAYRNLVASAHPDRGGDAVTFQLVREAWGTLRHRVAQLEQELPSSSAAQEDASRTGSVNTTRDGDWILRVEEAALRFVPLRAVASITSDLMAYNWPEALWYRRQVTVEFASGRTVGLKAVDNEHASRIVAWVQRHSPTADELVRSRLRIQRPDFATLDPGRGPS